MNAIDKKALMDAYKNRQVIGGVYCVRCNGNGRLWLRATRDIDGMRNRFNFALSTKGAPEPAMGREWAEYGAESFSYEVLEELKKGETQTDQEFADDINALYEIWLEKSQQGEL